jgi:hypothetical protein
MQARQLPLQRGWGWIADGLRLWRRNPAVLIFASFTYMLTLLVLGSIPLIGQVIAYLLMPIMSLGVLNTCRAIDEGRKVGPDVLFSGFKSNVPQLVAIGGFYLAGSVLVLMLTTLFDDGLIMRIMTGQQAIEQNGELPGLGAGLLVAVTLSLPVLAAYWFAPVLAGWWKVPAAKAMFFSFYACLQNWRPLLAFGGALLLLLGVAPSFVVNIAGMISPLFSTLLVLVLPLVLIPVTFASFYANARDVFGFDPNERPLA